MKGVPKKGPKKSPLFPLTGSACFGYNCLLIH
jgi:hypothetical protein